MRRTIYFLYNALIVSVGIMPFDLLFSISCISSASSFFRSLIAYWLYVLSLYRFFTAELVNVFLFFSVVILSLLGYNKAKGATRCRWEALRVFNFKLTEALSAHGRRFTLPVTV